MAMAFYHQHFKEYNDMLTHVELAIPNIKGDKDLKARTNFIAGQLHQQFGHDSLAYVYYENALKGTPPYELTFFTKYIAPNYQQYKIVRESYELKKLLDNRQNYDTTTVFTLP